MRTLGILLLALAVPGMAQEPEEDFGPVKASVPVTLPETKPVSPVAAPALAVCNLAPVQVELLRLLVSGAASPEQIRALVGKMEIAELSKILVAVAENPAAFNAVIGALPAEKVLQIKIDLFLTDPAGWEKVSAFLNPAPRSGRKFSANWMDAARVRLKQKILREGYSPAVLQEAEAILKKP